MIRFCQQWSVHYTGGEREWQAREKRETIGSQKDRVLLMKRRKIPLLHIYASLTTTTHT